MGVLTELALVEKVTRGATVKVIILQLYLQSDLIIQNIYKGNGIGIEGCRGGNIYSILYCWQYGSTGPAPEKPQT